MAGKRLITLAWFRGRAIEMPLCSKKESMLMGAVGFWVFVLLLLRFSLNSRETSVCVYFGNRFASEGVANLVLIKDN